MTISKSNYVAGVQCLKRLYLQVHEPGLAGEPNSSDHGIMEQGREVGMLARQLFPGGIEVSNEGSLDEAIRTTSALVANPEVSAIFEAAFEHEGVVIRVDILHRRRDGRWRLIEVKSTTDARDYHLDDVAIQSHVVCHSGVDLASSCLAHVNRSYVFAGGRIDPWRFFRILNLTRRIGELKPHVTVQLRAGLTVLAMPQPPDIPPGRHCTSPVRCEFFDRCNSPLPDNHIGYLPSLHASAAEALGEMGVRSIHDIPEDFPLSERQRRACATVQTGEAWFSADLGKELGALEYPLSFMDFESVNPAIPRFAGMRPYDQLPFQWSVHAVKEPGAEPQHHEFLATDASDPRTDFVTSLCAVLGESGSIVVYSQQFESQRLSELAALLPEFSGQIERIQTRLWDLLPIVRNHVYHPAFAGSYSLKAVLPALVPEMTYEGMAVANGREAGVAWEALVRGNLDGAEREKIRKALLDYCGQDTLAMVRLLERLRMHQEASMALQQPSKNPPKLPIATA